MIDKDFKPDLLAVYEGRTRLAGFPIMGHLSFYVDEKKQTVWHIRSLKTRDTYVVDPDTVEKSSLYEQYTRLKKYLRGAIHENDMVEANRLDAEINAIQNEIDTRFLK